MRSPVDALDAIRKTLHAELKGENIRNASLTEAERRFCAEGIALAGELGYELEGFEDDDVAPCDVTAALDVIRGDADTATTRRVEAFLSAYQ
jgi:hypothetical protein